MKVAVFTDNDFEKINGVTTTLRAVLAHAPPDLEPEIITAADLNVTTPTYRAFAAWGVGLPWYREMRIHWPRLAAMTRHVRRSGASVVHITTPGPVGLAGRIVARRLNLPLVGSFHTHLDEYVRLLGRSDRLAAGMRIYMRWLYGACQRLLVPSSATARLLSGHGYDAAKMAIWSRGVDCTRFDPARRHGSGLRDHWRVSERRPAVLYVGRLSEEKGLRLIEPVGRVLERERLAHRLIFVGDGPLAHDLSARCPDAVFTGALTHDEVAVAMASADLFLFPSTTDSLGNVVLEAQASGLPPIVSDQGGPQENLIRNDTGLVCSAGDASAFAQAASALIRDADRRRHMAAAARAYALSRGWAQAMRPLHAAWRLAAAERAASARHVTTPISAEGVLGEGSAPRRP